MRRFQPGGCAKTRLWSSRTAQRQDNLPLDIRKGHNMRVGIATDHGGFALKEELVAHLRTAGHQVVEYGATALTPGDDYPDYVIPLARAVAGGKVERGVAVCGSGVGAAGCAHKNSGARAPPIPPPFSARRGGGND